MSGASFAQPDVKLVLDAHGVIREASVSDRISVGDVDAWVGRPWLETVSGGGEKVTYMLEETRSSGVSAFRDVLQRFPSGLELPIEYTTLRVPGGRGGLLALGKNLQAVAELQSRLVAAQQATEREYWKLRDVETRYRLLFDASNEAVLTVGGEDMRIIEANPAAVRALGLTPGWDFVAGLTGKERDAFLSMLGRVREQGRAPGIVLHLGAAMASWAVRASLMAGDPGIRYWLHFARADARPPQSEAEQLPLDELLERLPDGFVVVGPDQTIMRANQAFLDLVQAGALGSVRGEPLGRWLSHPGADAAVLLANVARHRTVRVFETVLYGELGTETPVEISAARAGDGRLGFCGVLLRDTGRRLPAAGAAPSGTDPGSTPGHGLLQEVKAVTEAVEQRMIRDALERARGSRTVAAELLAISRQSLHTKLNRYGIADDGEATSAAD